MLVAAARDFRRRAVEVDERQRRDQPRRRCLQHRNVDPPPGTGSVFSGAFGGALYVGRNSAPLVDGNTIRSNRAGNSVVGRQTGVGGGIVSVVPGRFAIAAFSPRLNEAGNSVRSLNAIRYIAGQLGVGVFGANPN